MNYQPRLRSKYDAEIKTNLQKRFEYSSNMQVPCITKICLNQGIGKATADKKLVDAAVGLLTNDSNAPDNWDIAQYAKMIGKDRLEKLIIAGNISDLVEEQEYFKKKIQPKINGSSIIYIGPVNNHQKNCLMVYLLTTGTSRLF